MCLTYLNACALIFLTIFIVITCFVGDTCINFRSKYFIKNHVVRCIVDSTTHAIIGSISWTAIIFPWHKENFYWSLFEIIMSGILSAAIDVDHFIESRSLNFQDVINLKRRPFLHNTSLMIFIFFILLAVSRILWTRYKMLPFLFFISSFTHHLRDSHRRGLWFWGFETMPLHKYVYISLTLITVFLTRYFCWHITPSHQKYIPTGTNQLQV